MRQAFCYTFASQVFLATQCLPIQIPIHHRSNFLFRCQIFLSFSFIKRVCFVTAHGKVQATPTATYHGRSWRFFPLSSSHARSPSSCFARVCDIFSDIFMRTPYSPLHLLSSCLPNNCRCRPTWQRYSPISCAGLPKSAAAADRAILTTGTRYCSRRQGAVMILGHIP